MNIAALLESLYENTHNLAKQASSRGQTSINITPPDSPDPEDIHSLDSDANAVTLVVDAAYTSAFSDAVTSFNIAGSLTFPSSANINIQCLFNGAITAYNPVNCTSIMISSASKMGFNITGPFNANINGFMTMDLSAKDIVTTMIGDDTSLQYVNQTNIY